MQPFHSATGADVAHSFSGGAGRRRPLLRGIRGPSAEAGGVGLVVVGLLLLACGSAGLSGWVDSHLGPACTLPGASSPHVQVNHCLGVAVHPPGPSPAS